MADWMSMMIFNAFASSAGNGRSLAEDGAKGNAIPNTGASGWLAVISVDPERGLFHAAAMEAPYYIHTINPVLVELWGPMAIRWYGLAYVAGFAATYAYLLRASRTGRLRLGAEDIQNLLFYIVVGVMLGGRIGYLLFYSPADWARDPLMLFKVWQGGMSSHGGFLGLALAVGFFASSLIIWS
jgi:hypothetical protein